MISNSTNSPVVPLAYFISKSICYALGKKHTVVLSFSLWQNLKKLSGESDNDDGLQCIHGLKVISMFLVIMGHRIMFGVGSPMLNPSFVEDVSKPVPGFGQIAIVVNLIGTHYYPKNVLLRYLVNLIGTHYYPNNENILLR
jgi:hypothetical protein